MDSLCCAASCFSCLYRFLTSSLSLHTWCHFFVCGFPVDGSWPDLDSHSGNSGADNQTVRESVLPCLTEWLPNWASCHIQNRRPWGNSQKHRSLLQHQLQPTFKLLPHCWTMLQVNREAVYHQHCQQGWSLWLLPLKPDTNMKRPLGLLSRRLFSGPLQASLVLSQPFPRVQLFSAICGVLLWCVQCVVLECKTNIYYVKCKQENVTLLPLCSKHLLQVEKLDRLHLFPGSASVSLLGECVFSGELWGKHSIGGGPEPLATLGASPKLAFVQWISDAVGILVWSHRMAGCQAAEVLSLP